MDNRKHGVLLWFIMLTQIAVIIAFQHYYIFVSDTEVEYTLTWHLSFNLFYWLSWLAFYPLLNLLIKYNHIANKYIFRTIYYFLLPLVIVSIHQLAATTVITYFLNYSSFTDLFLDRLLSSQWVWIDLVLYFIMTAGLNLLELQARGRNITIKNSQLQTQLYNSQFDVIKSQLQPHFLFNTLNTLSTLILKRNSKESLRMISLLTRFLKVTVNENSRSNIKLSEELDFINDYLEIEKVRFKDKLEIERNIETETLDAIVPNLILQPVIENAVHYAVAPNKATGVIRLSARIDKDYLNITVEDNGPGLTNLPDERKRGLGLKITRERLAHFYSGNACLEFSASELGGLLVEFRLPFVESTKYKNVYENKQFQGAG